MRVQGWEQMEQVQGWTFPMEIIFKGMDNFVREHFSQLISFISIYRSTSPMSVDGTAGVKNNVSGGGSGITGPNRGSQGEIGYFQRLASNFFY